LFLSFKVNATEIFSNKRVLYSVWLIIPSISFIFFFTPKLGGPRDWDLFALPAFMLILSSLTIFFSIKKIKIPIQIIPLILIGLLNTFGFAMVNSDLKLSVARFEEIIELSKFKNLTKEYITLVNYTSHPELADYRMDFLKKAWSQPPYTQSDSVFVLAEFGQTYLEKGDKQRSRQYIEQALQVDSLYLNGFVAKINYLKQYGNKKELLNLAELIQHRFPDRAIGLMNAGVTFLQLGDNENGGECLTRAWELDKNDYLVALNYGIFQLQIKNYRNCIEIMKRAIEINKKSFLAHYYIAVSYRNLSRFSNSKEYLSKAKNLVTSPQDARLYNDLKKNLK
ncbi:MAG: tetratricopeptide repeat protein, partial [Candidatus Zixiibacteriota bacterium]